MRVFVGIKISDELEQKILEWQNFYRDKLDVRWMSGKNLHVTLVPPWDEKNVDSDKIGVDEICKKLQQIKNEPFEIKFEKITFGPPREPRLIWVEGSAEQNLVNLQRRILQSLDKKPENRPFKLHVTLARFNPEKFQNLSKVWNSSTVYWTSEVNSFVLFQSILSSKGAEYEVLGSFKL